MDQVIQEQVTHSQLLAKIQNSQVEPGIQYLITNAQASHTECVSSTVLVYGTTPKTVSESGIRFQLVPDYSTIPMYDANLADFSIGTKCIYGSRVWVNLTGNIGGYAGSFPGNLIALNSDWEQVPYQEGDDYTLIQMECKYDVVTDIIFEQTNSGLYCVTTLEYVQFFGFSSVDYCDWNQVKSASIASVQSLFFLNNSRLKYSNLVFAPFFINNTCDVIQNATIITNKFTSPDLYYLPCIAYNNCKNIRSISNTESIIGIPSTVTDYSFVTDDESGYVEHDFTAFPLASGDTLVLGCILNNGVAFTDMQLISDGNLPNGVNITVGIDTDAPTYATKLSDDINASVQYVNTPSARTTGFNRLIVLIADGALNSGVLRIAYKYL